MAFAASLAFRFKLTYARSNRVRL